MKFSLHMPDEWRELLNVAREEAGLASTQEFVRRILKNSPELRDAWVKWAVRPCRNSATSGGSNLRNAA
jgi:xanthine dehydrogenase iron-sulfur cluster and FAD-binding subunit A